MRTSSALAIGAAFVCASCVKEPAGPGQGERPAAAAAEETGVDARAAAITRAADTLLATLSEEQRTRVIFPWNDDEQRRKWSNFPNGLFTRGGINWAELTPAQQSSLMTLVATILSERGMAMVQDQLEADDILLANQIAGRAATGPGTGGGRVRFGRSHFAFSFVGKPSTEAPWMLQFGGHHLAINATSVGSKLTLSPLLSGGQPLTLAPGRRIRAVERESAAAHALLATLDPQQRGRAVVSGERIHVLLGAGQDGKTIPAEGVSAAAFTAEQKALLLALIEVRLGIINADDLAPLMAEARAGIDRTTFGWWGPTTPGQPAYWRVVGPSLILEYSPEDVASDPNEHAHNIYRNPKNDYGAAWAQWKLPGQAKGVAGHEKRDRQKPAPSRSRIQGV